MIKSKSKRKFLPGGRTKEGEGSSRTTAPHRKIESKGRRNAGKTQRIGGYRGRTEFSRCEQERGGEHNEIMWNRKRLPEAMGGKKGPNTHPPVNREVDKEMGEGGKGIKKTVPGPGSGRGKESAEKTFGVVSKS